MKQINKVTSIVLDCQTKTNTGSNDHQIYINELNDHNPCSTEYNLSENDYKTLKLANALIISNLFEMVFIVFGCTLIYMTIYYKWSPEFRVSLQLFILSDVIIALEKAFFFYTLINKDKKLKICLCLNMSSMMLKLVASGVLSDLSSGLLLQQLSKNFDFFHAKIKNTIENYVFIIVPLCFSKFFGKDYLTKNQSFICQKSKSIYVKP